MKKLILLMVLTNTAWAVNVNLLTHSHSPVYMLTEDTLTKESLPNETLIYSAYYNYVEDPLVVTNEQHTERRGTLIEGINALHLGIGYQSSNRFLFGLSTFAGNVYLPSREGTWAMGDTKLIGKYRMTANHARDSFAVIPELELPTGDETLFIGNRGLGYGVKFAYEHDYKWMQLNANLGYMRNEKANYKDINYKNRLLVALGVHVPLNDKWGAIAEGTTTRTMPFNNFQNPGEVYLGGRYRYDRNLAINAGASVGNLNNFGSNEFRLLLGLKYTPKMKRPYHFKHFFTKREREIIRKIVQIRQEIKFKHDSYELTDEGKAALAKIADLLKDESAQFKKVVIEGHANKLGPKDYNKKLSKNRAEQVRKELLGHGLDEQLLESVGYGEERPKPIHEWAKAKVENRRVQFRVLK